jgi:hypothetical protein
VEACQQSALSAVQQVPAGTAAAVQNYIAACNVTTCCCQCTCYNALTTCTILRTSPAQRCRASSVACHPCRSAAPSPPLQSHHLLL